MALNSALIRGYGLMGKAVAGLIAFLDRETFPNTAKQQPKARQHG